MEIDEERFRKLMDSLVKLLIHYEEELTAWYMAFQAVEKRKAEHGPPLDIRKGMESILRAPGLHVEGEAEYVEFEPLLHPIEPIELSAALDRATSAIARIQNLHK